MRPISLALDPPPWWTTVVRWVMTSTSSLGPFPPAYMRRTSYRFSPVRSQQAAKNFAYAQQSLHGAGQHCPRWGRSGLRDMSLSGLGVLSGPLNHTIWGVGECSAQHFCTSQAASTPTSTEHCLFPMHAFRECAPLFSLEASGGQFLLFRLPHTQSQKIPVFLSAHHSFQ